MRACSRAEKRCPLADNSASVGLTPDGGYGNRTNSIARAVFPQGKDTGCVEEVLVERPRGPRGIEGAEVDRDAAGLGLSRDLLHRVSAPAQGIRGRAPLHVMDRFEEGLRCEDVMGRRCREGGTRRGAAGGGWGGPLKARHGEDRGRGRSQAECVQLLPGGGEAALLSGGEEATASTAIKEARPLGLRVRGRTRRGNHTRKGI